MQDRWGRALGSGSRLGGQDDSGDVDLNCATYSNVFPHLMWDPVGGTPGSPKLNEKM
ncbi:hypothetical protein [Pseudovibrio sp. Tun.PSC04-5.I4]|uniref:hypothetical protein n=1 Tax=Pseudovibrio sp. Tun.PSC04-5.I4 TaxID=1798213 RepID=UPI0013563FD6|nr:hypothetical protein [Pseudovibrio sp. Tun.PSC04-5.I4]